MINAGVNIANVKAIVNTSEHIINKVNVIKNNVTTTVWTRTKELLNTLDAKTHYWRRETGNNWGVAVCKTNSDNASWNMIDCTNYKYCTVRINGNIDGNAGGSTANHTFIKIGFTGDPSQAIGTVNGENLVHKWNSTASGNIGSGTDGVAYDKWYDLTIDISNLTGLQTLNAFVGWDSLSGHSGTLYCSKIIMHN